MYFKTQSISRTSSAALLYDVDSSANNHNGATKNVKQDAEECLIAK